MTKETVLKRMPFLLMAACVAVLAGCGEKEEEPRQEQPVEAVQESGEECLQRAIDKLALGEVDVADEAAKKALELMPDSAEALLVAGQVACRKGDLARAAKDFNAVASEQSLPAALRAGALVSRAVTEIKQGSFDAARLTLFRALRLDRRNASVWYHLGMLSRNTFHFDEVAVEQFEMAARLSDPKAERTKKISQEIRAARAALTEAAAANPNAGKRDSSAAAKLLAEAETLRKKRMIRAAIKKYEAAFAADPFSYRAARETAYLLSLNDKSQSGVDKALRAYRAAIDQRPAVQDNYYEAAQLAYANRRWATAVSILDRAIAHDPENLKTLDLFIAALQKAGKGKQSEAWKAYRQELK
ncbi:MAG: tetratricopeptide repeat protein [Kiritimatiellae bacterium]|nr:tetratricopeptide repeat protein [Kiritimatiellia bacterium]